MHIKTSASNWSFKFHYVNDLKLIKILNCKIPDKNLDKDFDIPVEVYKRFALPSQYLYGTNSDIDKKAISKIFVTKRAALDTFIHGNRKNVVEEWSKIEEMIVLGPSFL